jgi:hypothetical protein
MPSPSTPPSDARGRRHPRASVGVGASDRSSAESISRPDAARPIGPPRRSGVIATGRPGSPWWRATLDTTRLYPPDTGGDEARWRRPRLPGDLGTPVWRSVVSFWLTNQDVSPTTDMDIEQLSVMSRRMTRHWGCARWRSIAWPRVEANPSSPGKGLVVAADRRRWASPANPCTPNTTRSHHDHPSVAPAMPRPGPSICGPARRLVAEVIAERAPITRARLVGGALDRVMLGVSRQQLARPSPLSIRKPSVPWAWAPPRRSPTADAPCRKADVHSRHEQRSPPHDACGESAREAVSPIAARPRSQPTGASPILTSNHQIQRRCCCALSA